MWKRMGSESKLLPELGICHAYRSLPKRGKYRLEECVVDFSTVLKKKFSQAHRSSLNKVTAISLLCSVIGCDWPTGCMAPEQMLGWIGECRAGAITQFHSWSQRFAKCTLRASTSSAHTYIHTDTYILSYKNTLAERLHLWKFIRI